MSYVNCTAASVLDARGRVEGELLPQVERRRRGTEGGRHIGQHRSQVQGWVNNSVSPRIPRLRDLDKSFDRIVWIMYLSPPKHASFGHFSWFYFQCFFEKIEHYSWIIESRYFFVSHYGIGEVIVARYCSLSLWKWLPRVSRCTLEWLSRWTLERLSRIGSLALLIWHRVVWGLRLHPCRSQSFYPLLHSLLLPPPLAFVERALLVT